MTRDGRLAAAITLSLALLPGTSLAASAATRVVDNDGKATSSSCGASKRTFKSVRKAVEASGASDTVKVCPGTYVGLVTVAGARNGLKIVAVQARKAVLKAPVASGATGALITINGVSGVSVKNMALRVRTWQEGDSLSGISAVGAKNVSLTGNDIGWAGDPDDLSVLFTGIALSAGTTGTVSGNRIKDPREDGISVNDVDTSVSVQGNTIRSLFASWPAIGGDDAIEVRGGASALVKGNTVTDTAASALASGVELFNADGTVVVRDNTVSGPIIGIRVRGDGFTVQGNTVQAEQIGISLVQADSGNVLLNTATASAGPGYGISADEKSEGNDITQNDVKGSFGPDCREENTQGGIENDWVDNEALDSAPSDLCVAPPG